MNIQCTKTRRHNKLTNLKIYLLYRKGDLIENTPSEHFVNTRRGLISINKGRLIYGSNAGVLPSHLVDVFLKWGC